jgi:hypothetical protein
MFRVLRVLAVVVWKRRFPNNCVGFVLKRAVFDGCAVMVLVL